MAKANQSVLKVLNWLKAKAEASSVLSMYPIGSVYMTENAAFDPNAEWGGTWVKIENRFLLGSGTKAVGAQGGEENVTLSIYEIPAHSHTRGSMDITGNLANGDIDMGAVSGAIYNRGDGNGAGGLWVSIPQMGFKASKGWSGYTSSSGGSQSHNNMPPYQVVNIWKRTA
ncbi:phage baseplate protein [Sutterella wadsworthensis]|uniref:phage baseplate protein n=1 Tax=Sutterella wadsworthensis TaxID=40545 RepID=UPI003A91BFAC